MKSLFMCNSKSKVEETNATKIDIKTESQPVLNVNQDSNVAEDNFASNASREGLIAELIDILCNR